MFFSINNQTVILLSSHAAVFWVERRSGIGPVWHGGHCEWPCNRGQWVREHLPGETPRSSRLVCAQVRTERSTAWNSLSRWYPLFTCVCYSIISSPL